MKLFENILSILIISCIACVMTGVIILITSIPAEPKTFEETYNKAYDQCLTEQQNNTKITNKEYYCVNYANAKVK